MKKQRERKLFRANCPKIRSLTFLFTFFFLSVIQTVALNLNDAKPVSIQNPSISVKEALEQVREQSGVYLLYQEDIIDKKLRLNLNLQRASFQEAMNVICSKAGLKYEVSKDHVLITRANATRTTQQRRDPVLITGKVVDESGTPLTGASIKVSGTTQGTIADIDGNFSIKVPGNASSLEVSFVGMRNETVKLGGKTPLRIVLHEDRMQMSEVIVTGYQTISKERATGAFGVINSTKLESKLQPDLKSVLEGQAAGVVLDKDGNIEIRGVSTFSAEKTPLIVVDGFPTEVKLEDLNPDNIT